MHVLAPQWGGATFRSPLCQASPDPGWPTTPIPSASAASLGAPALMSPCCFSAALSSQWPPPVRALARSAHPPPPPRLTWPMPTFSSDHFLNIAFLGKLSLTALKAVSYGPVMFSCVAREVLSYFFNVLLPCQTLNSVKALSPQSLKCLANTIHSSLHLFIQQLFIGYLLCARYHARCQGYSNEHSKVSAGIVLADKPLIPCL